MESNSSLFFDHCTDRSGAAFTGHCNSIGSFSRTFNVARLNAFGCRLGGPEKMFESNVPTVDNYSRLRVSIVCSQSKRKHSSLLLHMIEQRYASTSFELHGNCFLSPLMDMFILACSLADALRVFARWKPCIQTCPMTLRTNRTQCVARVDRQIPISNWTIISASGK